MLGAVSSVSVLEKNGQFPSFNFNNYIDRGGFKSQDTSITLSCLNDPWVSSLKLFQQECFKINSFEERFKTISGFEKKKVFLNNHMFLLLYRVQGWGCSLNALYILVFLWLYKTLNKCPYEGLVPSHWFVQFGWLRCSFVEIRCLRLANKDAFVTDLKANQKYTPRFSI